MAQQFLNGAQVPARIQQMRCKRMAQRMRRGAGGQPQLHPHRFHHLSDQPRVQCPPTRTQKQRAIGHNGQGTGRSIGRHRLTGDRDHRHHPLFSTLATNDQPIGQQTVCPAQ